MATCSLVFSETPCIKRIGTIHNVSEIEFGKMNSKKRTTVGDKDKNVEKNRVACQN